MVTSSLENMKQYPPQCKYSLLICPYLQNGSESNVKIIYRKYTYKIYKYFGDYDLKMDDMRKPPEPTATINILNVMTISSYS